MENASKALLMAAGVLVGLLVISIGVILFTTFSNLGKSTAEQMEMDKTAEWNQNYLKYYGTNIVTKDGKPIQSPILVTAHDIVSVANHAKQNNINYELEGQSSYNPNTYYVQVQVGKEANFEKKTDTQMNEFLKSNNLKSYICIEEPKVSSVTKRVMYIHFEEQK